MPTHFQQTVNILKTTKHAMGDADGLSTSGTQSLKEEFAESPIHKGEFSREKMRELFNALVLNGPADINENGDIVPAAGVDGASMSYAAGGTSGPPSIGGPGGAPKGPNLAAVAIMQSMGAMSDGMGDAGIDATVAATGAGAAGAGGAAGAAGAGGAGGAGGAADGGWGAGSAALAKGAGGGGALGGSDNPLDSAKIISAQAVGKLDFGNSTPAPCKIP